MKTYNMGIVNETFQPAEMQTLWGLSLRDWGALQSRKLIDATEVPTKNGKGVRLIMDIIQASQLGLQLALVREVGLSYKDAQACARECAADIAAYIGSDEQGGELVYAVTMADGKPAKWLKTSRDTTVGEVEDFFEGRLYVGLDVFLYAEQAAIDALKRPGREAELERWNARKKAN